MTSAVTVALTAATNPVNSGVSDLLTATITTPPDANTILLANFNGSGTTFVDQAGHTLTSIGSATQSSAQSEYGTTSLALNGSTDSVQVTPTASEFDIGASQDFTIECWIRIASGSTGIQSIFSYSEAADSPQPLAFLLRDSGAGTGSQGLMIYNNSVYAWWTGSISQGVWHYVTLSRQGGTAYFTLDGNVVYTSTAINGVAYPSSGTGIYIGGSANSSFPYWFDGNINGFRLSIGVARYTASFTPPAAPLSIGGTAATGTVEFFNGASPLGTSPVSANVATLSSSFAFGGTYPLTAQYSGDTNYSSATSPAYYLVVNGPVGGPTTTALTLSANPIVAGLTETLTATVAGSSPTGIVQFFSNGVLLGATSLSGGVATLTYTFGTTGLFNLQALYLGDIINNSSASNAILSVVTPNPAISADVTPYLKLITSEYQDVN